jgi:hypothetical protein
MEWPKGSKWRKWDLHVHTPASHAFAGDWILDELAAARETLIADVVGQMPDAHKKFLFSFVRGKPDWTSIGLPGAASLPPVKWRQLNLDKLTAEKRAVEVASLE